MLTAALIGLGNIAWKYDAKNKENIFPLTQGGAFQKHPETELVGGCSPDLNDREGFSAWSNGLPTFMSAEEMLKALKPDIVGICSPEPEHFANIMSCLDSGIKIIWLEKPPATNTTQLEELICQSEKHKATIGVNYFRRYLPQYEALKQLVAAKTYGAPLNIRITYSPGLRRNGCHLLDQIFYLTNSESYKLLWVEKGANTESPSFVLRLPCNALVFGCGGALPYHTNDISIQCTGGTFEITAGGMNSAAYTSHENSLFPGFFHLEKTPGILDMAGLDGYMQNSLNDLLNSAKSRTLPKSNLYSARLSQQLLEDILHEAKS